MNVKSVCWWAVVAALLWLSDCGRTGGAAPT